MYAQKIEWEEVRFEAGANRTKKHNLVWLTKAVKTAKSVNKLSVSSDLVAQLGWTDGERVNLYKAGNMFKMAKGKTGLIRFRNAGGSLCCNSWALCAELHPDINGTEFDAWVDNGELYFKRKG